mmetsp:Transcript_1779/g.3252  ORF Transcript_1779/g.3252 Transcript_1779/m.3252 type:complete len:103 (-) Transcript_1779:454-762(-)
MASYLRGLARQFPTYVVKGKTEVAWETTSELRMKYLVTTMEALPARVEAAHAELRSLREKVWTRRVAENVSVQEAATAALCAAELMVWFFGGRILGSGSLQM